MPAVAPRIEVRDAILDAAERLLARFGYRKMSVEDIAREAGIGKGTIYLHFSSKEEVVLSHVDRIVERVKSRLLEIAASPAPIGTRVRVMLVTRVLVRFDAATLYSQSLDDLLSALRTGLLARRARYFDAEAAIFAEILVRGQHAGEFEFGDARAAAVTLLDATNSLLPYSLSTAELGARDEVSARAGNIADLLLAGLRQERT